VKRGASPHRAAAQATPVIDGAARRGLAVRVEAPRMTVGKDPHRIQGKKGADEWDRRRSMMDERNTTEGDVLEPKPEAHPGSSDAALESRQVGGSRPGVESRVKEAIRARDGEEET
jgi:hypothetical protein